MPTDKPSRARSFFNSIMSAGDDAARTAYIRAFANIERPKSEGEYFDFKNEPRKENETQEHWSKALGGFANTEGGVLVWGVDARKTKGGVDAVRAVTLVREPAAFISRLQEFQRSATDPPVSGVDIVPIHDSSVPGQGFVVCLIPEGEFKPYRAEQADRQYYHRVNESFHVINRSMLASMFYPRTRPQLRIVMETSWRNDPTDTHQAVLSAHVSILNDGTATAKNTFVKVSVSPKLPNSHTFGLNTQWIQIAFNADGRTMMAQQPIHRSMTLSVCAFEWTLPLSGRSPFAFEPTATPYAFGFQAVADDVEPVESEVLFDPTRLRPQQKITLVGVVPH